MNEDDSLLKDQLISIFKEQGLYDDYDDLDVNGLINSLLAYGIYGLDDFESFFSSAKFRQLKAHVEDLLSKFSSKVAGKPSFASFIKNYLKKFKVKDENDLYLKLIRYVTESLVRIIDDFGEEVDIGKMESIKKDLLDLTNESKCDYVDFQYFFNNLLKLNKLAEHTSLCSKITNLAIDCFSESIEHFKEEIAPRAFIPLKASLVKIDVPRTTTENIVDTINDLTYLKKLKEDLNSIPFCLEKYLISLIFYIKLKILDKSLLTNDILEPASYDKLDIIISNNVDLLQERVIIEQFEPQSCVVDIRKKIDMQDWITALKELEKLLKAIRPLNILEMKHLIDKAMEAKSQIKNQDIILLLGGTGSGKSTTIHFLAGSKMVISKVEIEPGKVIEHITPVEPYSNPALNNVSISSKAESETRYINAIPVHFNIFSSHDARSTILCDSPGFGDTAGPEVDIANGIGLVEAIKGCKSVKPVILISYLMIGDRGEGIKKLAHLLVRMVSNIQDKLGCFSYVFTKYPSNIDIHASLLNIKKSIDKNQEESEDKPFMALFMDLLDKTEDGPIRLDPIRDRPLQVLRKLVEALCIQNPKDCFKFSITDESRNSINEQVRLNQLSIIAATKRAEYTLVKHKLDELQFLRDVLKEDFIRNIFKECLEYIINNINENYTSIVETFNRCLDNGNKLNVEDVTQYKRRIETFTALECLKSFEAIPNQTEALKINLKKKASEIIKNVKKIELKNADMKVLLENMKLLGDTFVFVAPSYEEICKILDEKLKRDEKELYTHLLASDYIQVSDKLKSISKSLKLFKEHLNASLWQNVYEKATENVKHHLTSVSESADKILKQFKLDKNALAELKKIVETIEAAKESSHLVDHIPKSEIQDIYELLILRIMKYFKTLNSKIEDLFKLEAENSFKQIEVLIDEMDA